MGWESHFNTTSFSPPVDGEDGNGSAFLDEYITTSATYGQNGYTTNKGHAWDSYITDEGLIREYAILGGLSRRMREGKLVSTTYYLPGSSTGVDLSGALAANFDLRYPRIKLVFDNGLVFFANHDNPATGSPWIVSGVPKSSGGATTTLAIQPNGFAAGDSSQLFVFFNAIPAGYSTSFDYVKYVDRWEMISNRAPNVAQQAVYMGQIYDGFPSSGITLPFGALDLDLFSEGTIYHDARLDVTVGAHGGLWNGTAWKGTTEGPSKVSVIGPTSAPSPQSLTISSTAATICTAKPEGFSARLNFSNGPWQDVTALVNWSATGATIDQSGAATATAPGPVTVSCSYTPPNSSPFTATLNRTAIDGRPSADAGPDRSVYPGTAVSFDASSAADPKQGPVLCQWDFGDGMTATGAKVTHVFTEPPGTRTVTLTVRDVEDNLRTDPATINVQWSNSTKWWDNFDDGSLKRYSTLTPDLWGIRSGALQQTLVAPSYQELTLPGSTHLFGDCSTAAEFRMLSTGTTTGVGLQIRKLAESDTPGTSGYYASVDSTGTLRLGEANQAPLSAVIPSFNVSAGHEMRVLTKVVGSSTRERVYVDGRKYLERTDSTPPAAGYTGLFTNNQKAKFDDLRITDGAAPNVTMLPLEYSGGSQVSFYIDDQDFFSNINTADVGSMLLTIKAEDGPASGATVVRNGWTTGATPLSGISTNNPFLTYENTTAGNSTWAKVTMLKTLDQMMDSFSSGHTTKTISYEMIVHDSASPANYTRKYVRYTRP